MAALRSKLPAIDSPPPRRLELLADYLVEKSVWLVGGDGWAYDIGFGGLDHVLSLRAQGQRPGARHRGLLQHGRAGVEEHAAGRRRQVRHRRQGRPEEGPGPDGDELRPRLRRSVAFGAKDRHTVQAFQEAASYDGPSLIIAYSHCIAHGYDLRFGAEQQKLAVNSGVWPLYRYDPRRIEARRAAAGHRCAARPGQRRRLHAQRDALPHGGEDRPGALPPAGGRRRATTPPGASHCTSNSPTSSSRLGLHRRRTAGLNPTKEAAG